RRDQVNSLAALQQRPAWARAQSPLRTWMPEAAYALRKRVPTVRMTSKKEMRKERSRRRYVRMWEPGANRRLPLRNKERRIRRTKDEAATSVPPVLIAMPQFPHWRLSHLGPTRSMS
ncbi:Pyridoxal 5'-phosphate synthase subunit snz1, partial [Ascosphaera pollenicola]